MEMGWPEVGYARCQPLPQVMLTLFDPANPASAIASVGTPFSIPDVPIDTCNSV